MVSVQRLFDFFQHVVIGIPVLSVGDPYAHVEIERGRRKLSQAYNETAVAVDTLVLLNNHRNDSFYVGNATVVADADYQIDTTKWVARIVDDIISDYFAVWDHYRFTVTGQQSG